MPGKKDSTTWVLIAAAVAAGIYFFTRKPVTVTPQPVPVAPANNTLSYLSPAETGVSDIISNLSVSSTVSPAPNAGPLQLSPPDSVLLQPLNLDLDVQQPGMPGDQVEGEENEV